LAGAAASTGVSPDFAIDPFLGLTEFGRESARQLLPNIGRQL
jgi:hypothetical protein